MLLPSVALALAVVAAGLAIHALARGHGRAAEQGRLRARLGAVEERLEVAERSAAEAAGRADAAIQLLLEKGLAEPGDLEPGAEKAERGPGTVH